MWHFSAKVNKLSRCMGSYRAMQIDESELPAHHHKYVLAICREEGRSQEKLAEVLCLNKSTVARALGTLEERGLVSRVPSSEDRRILHVYPTDKMRALCPKVRAVSKDWNEAVTADISEEELAVCELVLSRMEEKAVALLREDEK